MVFLWCLILINTGLLAQDAAGLPFEREIRVDFGNIKGPRSDVWRECVGAGRAAEGLRADWREQLKICQAEIGFNHIRFHGLLSDDMGVYAESKNGEAIYNWQYIDRLFDALLALRIRPFVEVGFMPSALASGPKTIFWWRANVTPPTSYEKWDGLVEHLVRHWTDRYGAEEVKRWFFEIWNEPNYPGFWGPRDVSRAKEEYFELYWHTAAAVKKVNRDYRVGGPAGAGPEWVPSLLHFCAGRATPLDFISYHAYGLGDGPSGLDPEGNRLLYLSSNLLAPAHIAASQRCVIDSTSHAGLPIHITEWSSSYSPRDPIHDSYFSAAYILEQLKRTEQGIASMSYWVFTDIFEENGPPLTPFHGGFGLLNLQGIRKPAFFAYRFLNQLGPTELSNADHSSWVCRDQRGGVQLLVWDLKAPKFRDCSNQEIFGKVLPACGATKAHWHVSHLPPGKYLLSVYRVGFERNDAYTAYLRMGAPAQLSRVQEAQLDQEASGKPELQQPFVISEAGMFEFSVVLRGNDVCFVILSPE